MILIFSSIFLLQCGASRNVQEIAASKSQKPFDVIAYFPSWVNDVATIDFSTVTQINYSFVLPEMDGTLQAMPNPVLLKKIFRLAEAHNRSDARKHDAKVFLAIGGAASKEQFESLSAKQSSRKIFITSVIGMLQKYGFDGVDIDWEYPTKATQLAYLQLLKELHAALSPLGKLVSIAVANHGGSADRILEPVGNYVDTINVMSYELAGFSAGINHYLKGWKYWSNRAKAENSSIRMEQIIMGIPFYAMADVNGKYSYVNYNDLLRTDPSLAKQKMVDRDNTGDYINYHEHLRFNGPELVTTKVKFSKRVNPGSGVMIWELSQDSVDPEASLLRAIRRGIPAGKKS